jgi:hypothetical protein
MLESDKFTDKNTFLNVFSRIFQGVPVATG